MRSPGTAYVLLHHYMGEIDGAFRSWGLPRGGTGAISNAIAAAAREAGVEIRTEASVARIIVRDNRPRGVVLENGDEIEADLVSSSLDPRRTFLKLVGEELLPDEFVEGVKRYQLPRIVRQGQPRARRRCRTSPPARRRPAPARRDLYLAGRRLHGARLRRGQVRRFSRRPYMDIVIPSLTDPSVAPPGKHVMSCFVQYAPYHLARRDLGRSARGLRRHRHRHARGVRAEPQGPHPAPPGRDPARSRARPGV